MQELLEMVLTHVRLAWLHRWLALLIMAVICVSGGFYVLTLPDTYRVSAKIHVDTGSLLRPAIEGLALDTNASAQAVALMRRVLLMRPNLAEIARATDLDLRARTPRQMDGLLSGLQRGIKLSQTQRGGIFTVSYTNQNPQLAKQVVDAVINLFLERSLGEARRSTVATQEFIEQQLKVYERKLIEAERRLIEFKGKNMGLMPGSASTFSSRRAALAKSLRDARLKLKEAKNRRKVLQDQMENSDDPALWNPFIDRLAGPFNSRIRRLETQVDQLLNRYTERHPNVVLLKQRIAELEAEKQAEIEAVSKWRTGAYDPNVENPVYQGLKSALNTANAEVAALEVRVAEFEKRVDWAARNVDKAFEVEAAYQQLNRDYGILQRNYQGFASRREKAEIGIVADQSPEALQIRVIEPPRIPYSPTGPNRSMLSMMVLAIGIGAGIGVAWLLSVINPVFFDVGQLAAAVKGPILGTVSFSGLGAFARPKTEVITYVASFLVVLVGYYGYIVLEPFDDTSMRALSRLWSRLL